MKLIQPNCRAQFAAEDIDFILSVLGQKLGDAECLVKLLADEEIPETSFWMTKLFSMRSSNAGGVCGFPPGSTSTC